MQYSGYKELCFAWQGVCYGFDEREKTQEAEGNTELAEKRVMAGFWPEVVVLEAGDQAEWICNAGNLKIEFDAARCPFSSNVFQAPAGVRLLSGPVRPGTNPGSYKFKLSMNDIVVGQGEVLLRGK